MKLGDVMTLSKGNLISIEDDREYIIAGVQNYGAGILNKRKVKGIELTMKKYQLIRPNQLMWCKVDTKNGAFGITKIEHKNSLASTNMALADIDTSKCHPDFIEYLFRISFFHEIITKASSGTTNRKYLTPTQLFQNIEIPDFNIDEQRKWIEKVDSIVNSGISTELTNQLNLVKKLRQQLLQDAVQGKLVPQNPKDEPASELLKKLKAEKEKLIAGKKIKKDKEFPPIRPDEIPFEIPENWVWCRLGEICTKVTDGFHNTPKKLSDGKIYISATHIREEGIKWSDCLYVSENDHKELFKKAYPKKGEILITNRGAGCSTPVIIDIDEEFSFQNAALIGFNQELVCNKYLFYFLLKSRDEIMRTFVNGGLQPMLSNVVLSTIPIPFPPLSEQKRIFQKLDELMQYCNELEVSIKKSESQNEKLLQQVLREALRKEPVE
jgi:type I restriction enzyme, S subunit